MESCDLTTECVSNILKEHYVIEIRSISKFPGYENHNFEILTGDRGDTKYFVKVNDGWDGAEKIRMQHVALDHIASKGITASRPLKTRQGKSVVKFSVGSHRCTLQSLTYLEGSTINEVVQTTEELLNLSFDIGRNLAELQLSLKDCICDNFIPSADKSGNDSLWKCGEGISVIENYLGAITDVRMKSLLQKYIRICKERMLPRHSEVTRGIVHGDFSDMNILVTPKSEGGREWKISGIIDFERAQFGGYLIGDLGVCIAYFMMKSVSLPKSDPFAVSREIIRGHDSVNSLRTAEKDLIFEFVLERLVVSYVIGQHKVKQTPENESCILHQSKHIPSVLEQIEQLEKEGVMRKWFNEY